MNNIRERTVEIGSKKYLIASDDSYIDNISNGFEPDTIRLFSTLVNKGDVILDIGANIGCTAIYFGDTCTSVHAFEPSPTTFSYLKNNISKSGMNNITLHNFAIGSEPGESTITFSPDNRSGGFVSDKTQASIGHTVEQIDVRRLDDTINSLEINYVDFIKIDVEGFEWHVLDGGRETLNQFQPLVVLELNHWCLNAFQRTSVPDFFDNLRSVSLILFAVDGNNYMNLHNPDDSYIVMYHHIVNMRFPNIVAGFDGERLTQFRQHHVHGFNPHHTEPIEEKPVEEKHAQDSKSVPMSIFNKLKRVLSSH